MAEWFGSCTSNTVISSLFLTELDLFRVVPGLTPHLAPVVQTLDSAIHWINHYPLDNSIGLSVYPLDSDLSGGQRYPSFEQLGPGLEYGQLVSVLPVGNIKLLFLLD